MPPPHKGSSVSINEAQLEAVTEEARLQALREKQFDLKREYDALQARLEKEHPDYYDLKYRFDTVGPTDVRLRALDAGTVLVEYFLGREQIYIFTLTGRDLEVTSVARAASLETEAGELRRAVLERDFASYARSAHRLYRVLLAPGEDRLKGQDFVVVPDGPLSVVPFEDVRRLFPAWIPLARCSAGARNVIDPGCMCDVACVAVLGRVCARLIVLPLTKRQLQSSQLLA